MKTVFKYYVVDEISEQVIGVFECNCDSVAKKFLVKGLKPLFEKKQLEPEDIVVFRCESPIYVFETASELVLNNGSDSLPVTKVWDLSSDFQDEFKESLKDEK